MRGAQIDNEPGRVGAPLSPFCEGTRGPRPHRDGEGGSSEAEPPEAQLNMWGLTEQWGRIIAGSLDCGRLAVSFRVRGAKRDSSEAGPGTPGYEGRRKVGTEGRPAGAQRQRARTHERKTRPPCVRGHQGGGRRKPGGGTGTRHAGQQGGRSA